MQTVEIHTHGGVKHTVQVEKYGIEEAQKLNEQLNSNDVMTVLIGQLIFSKIDIKQVIPIETVSQQPEVEVIE
ncbi:hypothetical protein QUF88_19195 [Bacillus sp. DX1.1]|uniref:hypothetical protein n=1 Tax=unclassified Bacillus (in: firmicutes) TaxID=185979 RepID=UPI0025708481|nr:MULTISPECIES: hypothetical protein [unclassified Bacillus (in: firmicutes)]MDM5155838.1 hypothetical protein [Bacillus sp. DX1.1]WJE84202.1 hypothetical protein QRE67_16725 [Bacillus sp. DX3.1]